MTRGRGRTARPLGLLLTGLALVAALLWSDLLGPDPLGSGGDRPAGTPTGPATGPATGNPGTGSRTDPVSGLAWVSLGDLPPEAAQTVALIDAGGPYPYAPDDGVFGNFEGILPDRERGYYREYTVTTPGSPDRGARRIVAGSDGELYWTADHYQSFERIER